MKLSKFFERWCFLNMNKFQKLLNTNVKLQIICYNHMFGGDIEKYTWHRNQVRLLLKNNNEYSIEGLKHINIVCRKNLIEFGYLK